MSLPAATSPRRGDFLVSLAIIGLPWRAERLDALQRIARELDARYQFWEVMIVAPLAETIPPHLLSALGEVPNMRLLRVDEVDNFYRLRLAAAAEAIGDVVVLTSGEEMDLVDLGGLAANVYEADAPIVMIRQRQGFFTSLFFAGLGRLINYRINPRDTLTAGFPRSWLALTLARPDADLLLRFERRSGAGQFRREPVPGGVVPRAPGSLGRRLRLLADLLASAAPRVLRSVAAFSLAVTLFAGLYAIYAVLVWCLKKDVAPGWLTTSLLQVVIVGFLGITVAAISIGIVKLLDRIEGILRYTIVDELTTVDFFSKVTDLNVETPQLEAGEPQS